MSATEGAASGTEDEMYDATAYTDAHQTPVVDVPIVRATPESLTGFGHLVYDYRSEVVALVTWPKTYGWRCITPGTGSKQALVEGDYRMSWVDDVMYGDNMAVNDAVVLNYATGRLSDKSRDHVLVRHANYHPDGGQIFYPKSQYCHRPYIMLLAPSSVGDDVRPEHFRAFVMEPGVGIQVGAGVWHQPPYFEPTAASRLMMFVTKQSSVFACVTLDTVKEFGVFLKVPLRIGT